MIQVTVHNAHRQMRATRSAVARLVHTVCRGEHAHNVRMSVVFIGSRACRRLNRTFLGHDYVTDVLSFPLGDSPAQVEGEIYVNLDRARRQAREYGVSPAAERDRLVVHGVLHLLGYDDGTAADADRMRRREDRYLFVVQEGKGGQRRK